MGALQFDAFTLDLSRRVLLRGTTETSLRPQSLRVLVHLAERSGELVTTTELIEACWDNPRQTNVNSLAQCIRDIRAALGEANHSIIRTVPRKGYIFAAPVSVAALSPLVPHPGAAVRGQDVSARKSQLLDIVRERWPALLALLAIIVAAASWPLWRWASRPAELSMMAVPSIAVLPFMAIGDEGGKDYAGVTLADDVTTELLRMPHSYSMHIKSAPGRRAPGQQARDVGRGLGARYLVLGSLSQEGGVTNVNVQLIEAEGSRPLWAEPFSYAPRDPAARRSVAARIGRAISAQVLAAEIRLPLPAHPEAGHFVMLGRSLTGGEHGVEANRQARALFDKALALNPNSVPALHGYARTRVNEVLNRWEPKETWSVLLDEAERAVMHAASLDPKNPTVHSLRGGYLRARGKHAEAIAAFEHALTLYAEFPLVHAELGRAKIDVGLSSDTVAHVEEAIRLSPNDAYIFVWYLWAGMAEARLERYRSAIDWLLKARQASRAFPNTIIWLAIAHAGLGEWEQARAYLEEYRAQQPNFSILTWIRRAQSPVVAEQRARIVSLLCQIGAPGCDVTTRSKL